AHHIHHRIDGGPTRLWNLLSLCEYHHNRHHDGEFDIRRTAGGDLCFETHDGLLLGTATGGCWRRPRRRAGP
ncbi:MAG TPA: HNH endonuclease signature motif containing protein, partial [Candidatus Dormibacteraeota bacterium]